MTTPVNVRMLLWGLMVAGTLPLVGCGSSPQPQSTTTTTTEQTGVAPAPMAPAPLLAPGTPGTITTTHSQTVQ